VILLVEVIFIVIMVDGVIIYLFSGWFLGGGNLVYD
jgi:hypothetical protein